AAFRLFSRSACAPSVGAPMMMTSPEREVAWADSAMHVPLLCVSCRLRRPAVIMSPSAEDCGPRNRSFRRFLQGAAFCDYARFVGHCVQGRIREIRLPLKVLFCVFCA